MISRVRRGRNQITLARAISKHGFASRAKAGEFIRTGRVTVDGRVVRSPDAWLDPRAQRIAVDGRPLRRERPAYLMMNKPAGYITTRSDEKGRRTVYDLLSPDTPWMFPVGRLDRETSGLLLLTNDTRFGELLTDPDAKVGKTYIVTLDTPLDSREIAAFEAGLTLPDGTNLKPVAIRPSGKGIEYEMTVFEGKNRQIRKMCEAIGHVVTSLRRVRIGSLDLGDLREGGVRPLTRSEREGLLSHGQ